MKNAPYTLFQPEKRDTCVLFAAPHSGRAYAEGFLKESILDAHTIRSSEDAFVDLLFDAAPAFGAPLLVANTPRAFVDLNRDATELDPALIRGVKHQSMNARIAAGLGVVPRVVAGARPIYHGKISMAEAQHRLNTVWSPYHRQLKQLLLRSHAQFGEAVLIDCHSMPHEAVRNKVHRCGVPEIVLGDRHGASAAPELVDAVAGAFTDAGFTVARNTPFAGAYITQQYGHPTRHQHVVQVEIDRSLYMDEELIQPNDQFAEVKARLRGVIEQICQFGRSFGRLAAE